MLASLSLHSLLSEISRDTYAPPGFTDEIQMDNNICNCTWPDEATSEFLCPLETTKHKINAVKVLKKFKQLLRITFVALVKFPGNGKYWKVLAYKYKQWLLKGKIN